MVTVTFVVVVFHLSSINGMEYYHSKCEEASLLNSQNKKIRNDGMITKPMHNEL